MTISDELLAGVLLGAAYMGIYAASKGQRPRVTVGISTPSAQILDLVTARFGGSHDLGRRRWEVRDRAARRVVEFLRGIPGAADVRPELVALLAYQPRRRGRPMGA